MNSNLTTNTLTMKLEELGLSFMAASLESYLAEQSRNENSFLERLIELVDLEYIPRRERASRTRLKISGMPQYKALDDFDLSWLKGGLSKQKFDELSTLAFIERKENIFYWALPGWEKHTCSWVWEQRHARMDSALTT